MAETQTQQKLESGREYHLIEGINGIDLYATYVGPIDIDNKRYHSFFHLRCHRGELPLGDSVVLEFLVGDEILILDGNTVKCKKGEFPGFTWRGGVSPTHPFFNDEKKRDIIGKILEKSL